MGTYTVETPSGATVDVEAADDNEALMKAQQADAASRPATPKWQPLSDQDGSNVRLFLTPKINQHDLQWLTPDIPTAQASTTETPGVGADVLKSVPHFAETAASIFFGLPGDIIKGGRWLATKAGVPESAVAAGLPLIGLPTLLTGKPIGSEEIKTGIESMTGPLHEPETRVGKTIDIAAMLVPSVIGGPEAVATKLATRVAVPAAAAGAAAEVVKATGKPELEPWAEAAALLVSPFAISKSVEPMLASIQRKNLIPTTQELKALRDAHYKIADMTSVEVDKEHFGALLGDIATTVAQNAYDVRAVNAGAANVLTLMQDALDSPIPITLKRLQNWRRIAGKLIGTKSDEGNGLGELIYGKLSGFMKNPAAGQYLGKSPQDVDIATDALKAADELHSRYKNSQLLDKIYKMAKNRLANYREAGEATGLRQKFRQLADKLADVNSKEYRFFTPEMREAIESVARGTPTSRALRAIGSFVPWGLKGAAAYAGPLATAALLGFSKFIATIAPAAAIIPIGAKMAEHALTKAAANRAADLIRLGKTPPPVGSPTYPELLFPLAGQQLLNQKGGPEGK